jgi:hypothetical protein
LKDIHKSPVVTIPEMGHMIASESIATGGMGPIEDIIVLTVSGLRTLTPEKRVLTNVFKSTKFAYPFPSAT